MKLIYFFKMWKILCRLGKFNKKFRECFPFLRESRLNTLPKFLSNNDENTCDRQSTCSQTVLRHQIWITNRDVFKLNVSQINGSFR